MLETEIRNFEKWQEEEAMERFKNIPLIIGSYQELCPKCGKPMSFAYGNYFCRQCGFRS